jgi:TP901 family phage tail tape measure protein
MPAQEVASLYATIRLADQISSPLRNVSSALSSLGGTLQRVGLNVSALSVPLGGLYAAGLNAAAGFEAVVNQLQTFGGLAGDQLEAVRQRALQLGADTMFSASDAASAMLELVKAGQDVETAMESANAAMTLAATGGLSMQEAASVLATTLNNFNLDPLTEATRVVDALAKAANASTADVTEMAQALANVGALPAQFGMSIEETAAVLAVFADSGVRGAEAGTQLRSMLLNMTRPTDEVREAWERLGTSFYTATGQLRPLDEVIDEIAAGLRGMTTEEQNEILQRLAGSYGVVGLSALVAAGGIDTALAAMEAAPEAAALAEGAMSTFNGRLEALKGSLETVMINVFTPFMENTLKPLVDTVISVVNSINEWAQANPELANTLVQIGAIVIAVGPALIALGTVMQGFGFAISTVTTIVGGLSAALTFLLSPIGLAIAAAAALTVAYLTNFGGVRDFIDNEVRPRIEAFIGVLAGIWEAVRPGLEALINWFGRSLANAYTFLTEVVVPGISGFINMLAALWQLAGPALEALYGWFMETGLPAVQAFLQETVLPAVQGLIDVLAGIWDAVRPALEALTAGIGPVMNTIAQAAGAARDAVQGLIDAIGRIPQGLGAWQGVGQNAQTAVGMVTSGQVSVGQFLNAAANAIGAEIRGRASGGPVRGGRPYIVGEAGPELFVPASSGMIVPNSALQGGQTVNVYLTAYGASAHELYEMVRRAARERAG